jgi:hypothetical protein
VRREVRPAREPRAPLFFFSYAHNDGRARNGPNSAVGRFFQDLSENVAEMAGSPAGADPGFMDRSMPGGTRWTPELLHAVGTCQVFIALLSAPYLESDWCAMEWDAFSRRTVLASEAGPTHETCIIPVLWAPVRDWQFPPVVRKVQRFSPEGLRDADIVQYRRNGIFGLLQLGRKTPYRTVVFQLAYRVAEVYYTHQVEPRVFGQRQLRNVFEG